MDCDFLKYLLVLILISIVGLFLYQAYYGPAIIKRGKHSSEEFMPIIWDTCTNNRTGKQPVHRVGPVINFHQSFKPVLPELGWRNLYLSRYNNSEVPNDTNFDGTIIRNFLNNLDNVDNIYRKCT